MNRPLVALIIACAAALPQSAPGQIANVRLYGNLNLDLELVRGKQQDGSNPTVNRVSSNSSRLGIRGTDYIGNGQVAIFQIESSINGDANAVSVGAFYSKGPLDLGLAYERNNNVRFAHTNDDALSVAGGYDFGTIAGGVGLRVGAVYERLKYDTPVGELKRDFWGISATAPVGGGSIYAFWGHAGNGKGSAVDGTSIGGLTKGPDSASDQWEISYSYPLSLRTLLYAGYVRLNN